MLVATSTAGRELQRKALALVNADTVLLNGPTVFTRGVCDHLSVGCQPGLTLLKLRPYIESWPLWVESWPLGVGGYGFFIRDQDCPLSPSEQFYKLPHWEGRQLELRLDFLRHIRQCLLKELQEATRCDYLTVQDIEEVLHLDLNARDAYLLTAKSDSNRYIPGGAAFIDAVYFEPHR